MLEWLDVKESNQLLKEGAECYNYRTGLFDGVATFKKVKYVLGFDGYGFMQIRRPDKKYVTADSKWISEVENIKIPKEFFNNEKSYERKLNKFITNILKKSI